MAKRKKKKKRSWILRSNKERKRILRQYSKLKYGEKELFLIKNGIGWSHIAAWRKVPELAE